MRRLHMLLLIGALMSLVGCGHGSVMRVISNTTRTDHIQMDGKGGFNRVLVTESRLADERGREWTETAIVGIEPVPGGMAQIEAEMFAELLQKSQESGTSPRQDKDRSP